MLRAMQDAAPDLIAAIPRWAETWGVPGLETRLEVSFSTRMSRSLGRCHPERRRIRLASWLREAPGTLLAEVLCHEAAHVAVFELHGRACRPHGGEWRALMRQAGYEARARIPEEQLPPEGRRVTDEARRRRAARTGRKRTSARARRLWPFG
jgi:hypothetical protein